MINLKGINLFFLFCSFNKYIMSYTQSNTHKLTEFIPTYVPHSDYLPNRVVDVRQNEANQWVLLNLCS